MAPFEEMLLTIRHTVNETRIDGKYTLVLADTTKTESSYRTLPLVAPFEAILKRMKAAQEENRMLCGNCYCKDYVSKLEKTLMFHLFVLHNGADFKM